MHSLARLSTLTIAAGIAACAPPPAPVAPSRVPVAALAATTPAPHPDLEVYRWTSNGEAKALPVARVVLLDPGHGARQALRLHPGRAAPQKVRIETEIRDRQTHEKLSTVAVEIQVALIASDEMPGVVLFGYAVDAANVTSTPPGTASPFDGAERLDLRLMLSPRGQLLGTMVKTKDAALGERGQRLARAVAAAIAVPLPDEPVGEGARWLTREVAPMNYMAGMAALVETTYTLEKIENGGVRIKSTAQRIPLFDHGRALMLPEDTVAAGAARDRMATQSMLELSRGIDPIGRDEGLALFEPTALAFGAYARATRFDVGIARRGTGGAAPTPDAASLTEAELVTTVMVGFEPAAP